MWCTGNDKNYSIRLPSHLFDRIHLIPDGRRSQFIREALETALNYSDQSVARLVREIDDLERQLNVKKGLLKKQQISLAEKEETEKKQEESKKNAILGIYKKLCNKIISSMNPSFWGSTKDSTDTINKQFQTKYTSKQLNVVVKKIVDGCSTVEEDFLPYYKEDTP